MCCRNMDDSSNAEQIENESAIITESQIAELESITDVCEKKRRKSYVYISDSNSDSCSSNNMKSNFGSVSHGMGSKYNESPLSLSACANFNLEDEIDGRYESESLPVSCRVNGGGFNREIHSSSSGSIIGKCNRAMMEGHLQSSQEGSQRTARLQNVPPLSLFSRLKSDSSSLSGRVEEVEVQAPRKKYHCPIQSKIVDLINLCKSNMLGSNNSPVPMSRLSSSSSPNSHSSSNCNSHTKNGELLQISDEEMLNFPKLFTDAFNIGDYEGVSRVRTFVHDNHFLPF